MKKGLLLLHARLQNPPTAPALLPSRCVFHGKIVNLRFEPDVDKSDSESDKASTGAKREGCLA